MKLSYPCLTIFTSTIAIKILVEVAHVFWDFLPKEVKEIVHAVKINDIENLPNEDFLSEILGEGETYPFEPPVAPPLFTPGVGTSPIDSELTELTMLCSELEGITTVTDHLSLSSIFLDEASVASF